MMTNSKWILDLQKKVINLNVVLTIEKDVRQPPTISDNTKKCDEIFFLTNVR